LSHVRHHGKPEDDVEEGRFTEKRYTENLATEVPTLNHRRMRIATCPNGNGCTIFDGDKVNPACIPCIFALMDHEAQRLAFYNGETGAYIQRWGKSKKSAIPMMFLGQQSEEIHRLRRLFRIVINSIQDGTETAPNSPDQYIS